MRKILKIIFILILVCSPKTEAQNKPIYEFAEIDKKALTIPLAMTQSTEDIAKYIKVSFTT